jgi:TPR repeat protein
LIFLMVQPASAGMLSDALEWLGIEDADSAYQAHDYSTAMRRYRVLADKGDPSAMWRIGVMYRMGFGVPENPGTALYWFSRASDKGFSIADYDIATMYEEGEGVRQSNLDALHWYCRAMYHNPGNLDATEAIYRLVPGKDLDEVCLK